MSEDQPIPKAFLTAFESDGVFLVPERKPYISEEASIPPEEIYKMFTETSTVLDGYFGIADVEDQAALRSYLYASPITFLREALQGNYLINNIRTDNKEVSDDFPEKRSVEQGIIWGNSFTAYNWTKRVFSVMPHIEENYPSHLLVTPPRDPEGFALRVIEISDELAGIAEGQTPYKQNPRSSASLWRTFAFIKTGADITS